VSFKIVVMLCMHTMYPQSWMDATNTGVIFSFLCGFKSLDEIMVWVATKRGEGGFGAVYLATDKQTGEFVAVKKISKRYTDDSSFQQEMNSLLHIRQSGGHPNICSLRENFDEGDFFYLVIDLVRGGEMFDRLIEEGAYSEADAARLVQEVGSALLFLHGIGMYSPTKLCCVILHQDHGIMVPFSELTMLSFQSLLFFRLLFHILTISSVFHHSINHCQHRQRDCSRRSEA
jgi:Protein kinase domain